MSQLLLLDFGGYSLWDYITVFFDYIPKIMYFLYAALASVLDAIQCLMRKLIGLDTYWHAGEQINPSMQSDPVLNFIYGILGIGDNSVTYSPLSTVFWSLAIFGLIVLVISTMVAIIKSHYNEDSAKTSPVGYIYTALKSIFTFGITPLVVIFGFWLSSFLLQTLDNITAGPATPEKIVGIYGPDAANKLKGMTATTDKDGNTTGVTGMKSYSRYDFFGFGSYATSETISGLLFKTCAYDANRVREGKFDKGGFGSYNGFFGSYISNIYEVNNEVDKSQGSDQWRASTAYQIDYAFANNLNVSYAIYTPQLYAEAIGQDGRNILITIANIDVFALAGVSDGFSKYNVGLVWYYYDLWRFNFLVGFLAGVTLMALLFNIILGVMTRLIKSAALFLIYPATLGLAPLDDFGAFKKWRTEFMQQVLMAFGSIIGMNVFFLILPYLYEFRWFNFVLLDYMVHVLFMVVGLQMVKQLIAFMSTLVGGADAQAAGAGVADGVKSGLQKGAGMALGAANVALKAAKFIPGAGGLVAGAAQIGVKKLARSKQLKQASKNADYGKALKSDADFLETIKDDKDPALDLAYGALDAEFAASDEGKKASKKWDKMSAKDKAQYKNKDDYMRKELAKSGTYGERLKIYDQYKQALADGDEETQKSIIASTKEESTAQTNRAKQIRAANYMDEETGTKKVGGTFMGRSKQEWGDAGRDIGAALLKGLMNGMDASGIKPASIIKPFQNLTNNQYDDKGNKTGSWNEGVLALKGGRSDEKVAEERQKAALSRATGGGVKAAIGGFLSGAAPKPPGAPKPKAEEASLEASKGMKDASAALLEISQKLGQSILKLDKTVEKMDKASTKK